MKSHLLKSLVITAALCASASTASAADSHCCHQSPNVTINTQHGVSVYRPTPLMDVNTIRQQVLQQERANALAQREQARRAIANQNIAVLNTRLARIEAQQEVILARQTSPHPQRRRTVYSGNPPFFGSNGFIGNSNFSEATFQSNRRYGARKKSY